MPKALDLTNKIFGQLTVLYQLEERNNQKVMWHCKCVCGKECDVMASYLVNGHTKSCGCLRETTAKQIGLNNLVDLTNQKFNHLTVIKRSVKNEKNLWECLCDCGNLHYVSAYDLKNNNIKSCGCQQYNKQMLIKDIVGQRFGKLEVLEQSDKNPDGSYNYICK